MMYINNKTIDILKVLVKVNNLLNVPRHFQYFLFTDYEIMAAKYLTLIVCPFLDDQYTICIPENRGQIFGEGEPRWFLCLDCCFASGLKMMEHVSLSQTSVGL